MFMPLIMLLGLSMYKYIKGLKFEFPVRLNSNGCYGCADFHYVNVQNEKKRN